MISLVTNYASMVAQDNLQTNQNFMTSTIEALTSGYRINSSGDDAAGLAVANGYRSNIAELTQGVLNANEGVSQLQIADGGLNNISTILDRLQTLATESATSTFNGDRTTLNNEYQSLLTEVDRQASNIGLTQGGNLNTVLNVYIGGGNSQGNSQVVVDLSGTSNQVSAESLGLSNTNLLGTGVAFGSINLNNQPGGTILAAGANGSTQTITVNLAGGTTATATISSTSAAGITVADAVQQLNNSLSSYGISASVNNTTGELQLSGNVAFTASANTATNASTGLVAHTDIAENTSMYMVNQAATNAPVVPFTGVTGGNQEALTFTSGGNAVNVTLTNANAGTAAQALQTLNTQLAALGINAVQGPGGDIQFEGTSSFTVAKGDSENAGVFAATGGAGAFTDTATAPVVTGSSTANSLAAVTAVTNAVQTLGLIQGRVGAGENTLGYAIDLANSQVTNFSSAESQIRDADVATEAANLTQAQVLEQASVAAMAQANSAPQALLKLLQ
jgi:flagellin